MHVFFANYFFAFYQKIKEIMSKLLLALLVCRSILSLCLNKMSKKECAFFSQILSLRFTKKSKKE